MRSTRRGGGGQRGRSRGSSSNGYSHDSERYAPDELNADLSERVGRNRDRRGREKVFTQSKPLPATNQQVGRYLRKKKPIGIGAPAWTLRPEIPSVEELLPYSTFETVSAPVDAQPDWLDGSSEQFAAKPHAEAGWDDTSGPQTWDDLKAAKTSREPEADATSIAAVAESTGQVSDSEVDAAQSDLLGDSQPASRPRSTSQNPEVNTTADANFPSRSTTDSAQRKSNSDGPNPTNGADSSAESPPNDSTQTNGVDVAKSAEAGEAFGTDSNKPAWDDTGVGEDAWATVTASADPWVEDDSLPHSTAEWNEPDSQGPQSQAVGWNASEKISSSNFKAEEWEWPTTKGAESQNQKWGVQSNTRHNEEWGARPSPRNDEDWEPNEENEEGFSTVVNKIQGPWDSKAEYLRNHYLLLREDSLRNLRNGLQFVRATSDFSEGLSTHGLGIYDQVHVCGVTFSHRGLGIRVAFSLGKVGKKVRWEQSPRLKSGSLVVLMSPDKTITKVGVVAARLLENLHKDPPQVDLFLSRPEDLDLDCAKEWIMIEERTAYFEAERHTMVALQRMADESFPLQEHLVEVQQTVEPPAYLSREPVRNLTPLFDHDVPPVDMLQSWPREDTELDESQMTAVQTILTKKLALVQGPPGTGKTHVSVQALKVLIANMAPNDPAIIITCQTNHALDQLLRHVSEFEPQFARLGWRTKDMEVVGKRTMFELSRGAETRRWTGLKDFLSIASEMRKLIGPLVKNAPMVMDTLSIDLLQDLGVLTGAQYKSLVDATKQMVVHDAKPGATDPIVMWVGTRNLEPVQTRRQPILLEWEDYEVEEEQEEVQEAEAEAGVKRDEDEIERLPGDFFTIGDTWAGKGGSHPAAHRRAKELLSENTDLYKIRSAERGIVYCYLQQQAKLKIAERLRELWPKYYQAVESRNVHKFESQEVIAREQKVVGMTTTGLSKYRGLVSALRPKIVLIEEAAETLEAPVIAACVESLEHLILVGDHKQLRPHCNVNELALPPYHLNISLFERLVDNGVHYSLLRRQRRMKPEIRRLINPIYGDKIRDHKSVRDRPPVPGMGGLTTWFLTHEMIEDRDHDFSAFNMFEAEMIFGLVQYLIFNGMKEHQITVLTFYRAQVRALGKKLRTYPGSANVKVVTVDSYQGEENDVVILSLVRSNLDFRIGFVGNENRICVALSRAKRGFYVFGNGQMLATESKVWSEVLSDVYNGSVGKSIKEPNIEPRMINPSLPRRRIGFALPLWCARHRRMFYIRDTQDWNRNVGGCDRWCRGTLKCGHQCLERCHPWSHDSYTGCRMRCAQIMECGHSCSFLCGDFRHACIRCEKQRRQAAWEEPDEPVESYQDDDANFTKPVLAGPLVEFEQETLYEAPSPATSPQPARPEAQQQQGSRMGRLLEAEFEDLHVGGDGYTYDSSTGRPMLQGQKKESDASPQEMTPLSPSQHYDAVYNADRHAQRQANGSATPLGNANNTGMHDGAAGGTSGGNVTSANVTKKNAKPLHPRRFVNKTGSEGVIANGALQGPVKPSNPGAARGGTSRTNGIAKEETAAPGPEPEAQPEPELEPDIDLLGEEGDFMGPAEGPGMSQAMADLSLLD